MPRPPIAGRLPAGANPRFAGAGRIAGPIFAADVENGARWRRHIKENAVEMDKKKNKLLLVEDNEMNRDMLSRRLQRSGFEVVVAEDGAQGIAIVRSERPDLVLMDLSLPVMDGWEATARLKGSEETRAIPVIVLTAHALEQDRLKAIEMGCDDFDTKPVDLPRLLQKIEQLLGRCGSTPP